MECEYCKNKIQSHKNLLGRSKTSLEARTAAIECDLCRKKLCDTEEKLKKYKVCNYMKSFSENEMKRSEELDKKEKEIYAKNLAFYTRIKPEIAGNFYPKPNKNFML